MRLRRSPNFSVLTSWAPSVSAQSGKASGDRRAVAIWTISFSWRLSSVGEIPVYRWAGLDRGPSAIQRTGGATSRGRSRQAG